MNSRPISTDIVYRTVSWLWLIYSSYTAADYVYKAACKSSEYNMRIQTACCESTRQKPVAKGKSRLFPPAGHICTPWWWTRKTNGSCNRWSLKLWVLFTSFHQMEYLCQLIAIVEMLHGAHGLKTRCLRQADLYGKYNRMTGYYMTWERNQTG